MSWKLLSSEICIIFEVFISVYYLTMVLNEFGSSLIRSQRENWRVLANQRQHKRSLVFYLLRIVVSIRLRLKVNFVEITTKITLSIPLTFCWGRVHEKKPRFANELVFNGNFCKETQKRLLFHFCCLIVVYALTSDIIERDSNLKMGKLEFQILSAAKNDQNLFKIFFIWKNLIFRANFVARYSVATVTLLWKSWTGSNLELRTICTFQTIHTIEDTPWIEAYPT